MGQLSDVLLLFCQISFLVTCHSNTYSMSVWKCSLHGQTRIVLPGVGLNGFTRITPVIIFLHFIEVPTDRKVVCYASVMVSRCGHMINLNCNSSHRIINVLSSCFSWGFDLKIRIENSRAPFQFTYAFMLIIWICKCVLAVYFITTICLVFAKQLPVQLFCWWQR